jgi:hypothetical protein
MEGTVRLGGSFGGSRRESERARAVGAAQWRRLPAQAVMARGGGWEGGAALVIGKMTAKE